MTCKRIIFSIAAVTLVALTLYLLAAFYGLRDPAWSEAPLPPVAIVTGSEPGPAPASAIETTAASADVISEPVALSGSRLLEIFGRVTDQDGRPLEDVLITEERYFFTTRSDADGNYRLLLDLPMHRYPELNFLRYGYAGDRVTLKREQVQQKPFFELDVTLADNPDSVRLSGRVSNDHGAPLEGARVDLTGLQAGDDNNYYLTVFSGTDGGFVLEGVPAERKYKLSVNLTPEYSIYLDSDFRVSHDPRQLQVKLKSLKFIDIDGMILNRQGAPVPDFEIVINNVTTGAHKRTIISDSSGFFSLRNFPLGEVSFTTRGPEFFRISGLFLTDTEYRNLVLTIDRGSLSLSGWISTVSGHIPERAMVTLDRTDREGLVEYHQYSSQSIGNSGRFTFAGLGAGEYRLTVFAQGYQRTELKHRLESQSDEIRIILKLPE